MKRGALSLAALAVGATIGWFCGTTEYRSTATVQLVPATPRVLFQGTAGAPPSMFEAHLQSLAATARSPRVLAAAMRRPEWQAGLPSGLEPSVLELGESISATPLGAGVIDVSCQLADPSLTALTANAVADTFVDVVMERVSGGRVRGKLAETGARYAADLATLEATVVQTPETVRTSQQLRQRLGAIRTRIEALEVESSAAPRVQVLVRAQSPTEPLRGSRTALASLGALAGLVLGAGSAAALSRRERSRDEGGTR